MPNATSQCVVRVLERAVVRDGEAELYVEPSVFRPAGDGFLVAGQPVYAWRPDGVGGASPLPADFFGVLVAEGSVTRIPRPPGIGPIGRVRGVPTGSGAWAFVFEGLDRPSATRGEPVAAYFAEYGPAGWGRITPLPSPPDGRLEISASSPLVVSGDTLQWAVPFTGQGGAVDVLRYQFGAGASRVDTVASRWADGVTLAWTEDRRTWLAVVGLDPEHGAQLASVRLRPDDDRLLPARRLTVGAPGVRFRRPTIAEVGGDLHVAWQRLDPNGRVDAWLSVARTAASEQTPPVLLAHSAARLELLRAAPTESVWATMGVDPITSTQSIGIHRVSRAGAVRSASMPSPYSGPFSALASPSGDILVVGPEALFDPVAPFVRSLVLRLNLSCNQTAAANHRPGR
ncbi:MAG: hypothetical protein OEN56_14605 [Gemmatimonadota bacterium]|nr:hypothetical protein [Gemmatimonadota bacterium]